MTNAPPPSSVALRLERPYRVRFDEAGADGTLRASGYLRFAQDLAWMHSESAGFGRDWYAARGLTWLVRAIELDLLGDTAYGSELRVTTEVVGFRRVWARRRSEFHATGAERPTAVAITDWVLLNARGVPARVPEDIARIFATSTTDFTPARLAATDPPAAAARREFRVRNSELDPMAHVNNASYLDYLDEQALVSRRPQSLPLPRRYRAEFLDAAELGDDLVGRLWSADDGLDYLLAAADGRPMLRGRLEFDPASWVGG